MSNADLERQFYGGYTSEVGLIDGASEIVPTSASGLDLAACEAFSIQMQGTFTLTNNFEVSNNGVNWQPVGLTPAAGGAVVTSATTEGIWFLSTNAFKFFRCRNSAYTSGACNVTIIRGK